jgi:para-aminobenzoate synthetase/4-amino-4-deoxychorismate lyase
MPGVEPARVRLRLARDGDVTVGVEPMPPPVDGAVRIAVDDDPVDPTDALVFHKVSRRQRFDAARARHPGADDVVLVNDRGEVTESTIANVALRIDGRWYTPTLDTGCLPGTLRAELLEAGRLTERALTVADLRAAEGIALLNSTRGWRDAVLVDDPETAG